MRSRCGAAKVVPERPFDRRPTVGVAVHHLGRLAGETDVGVGQHVVHHVAFGQGAVGEMEHRKPPPDVPAFVRLARPILMDRSEDAELLARIFRIHPFPVEHQFGAQLLRVTVTHRHALDRGVVDAQRVVEEGVRVVAAQFVAREDTHVGPEPFGAVGVRRQRPHLREVVAVVAEVLLHLDSETQRIAVQPVVAYGRRQVGQKDRLRLVARTAREFAIVEARLEVGFPADALRLHAARAGDCGQQAEDLSDVHSRIGNIAPKLHILSRFVLLLSPKLAVGHAKNHE